MMSINWMVGAAAVAFWLAVAIIPVTVSAQSPEASAISTPSSRAAIIPRELVVTLQHGTSVKELVADFKSKKMDVQIAGYSPTTNTVLVRLPATEHSPHETNAALQTAFDLDSVDTVEPNVVYGLTEIPNDPLIPVMKHLAQINASSGWDLISPAKPIVVAVLDTGIMLDHEDISANLWTNRREIADNRLDDDGDGLIDDIHGWNFVDGNNQPLPASTSERHGTHIAGTLGAVGNNMLGGSGVAWKAGIQLMPLRICVSDCSLFFAVSAINYAVEHGARVINISWGGPTNAESLRRAIENAAGKGVLIVAAAGNGDALHVGQDNDAQPFYPAGYKLPNIIAVAAVDELDNLTSFSNYGKSTVHIAAPGSHILGPVPVLNQQTQKIESGYRALNGTSQAAPLVAGTAALLLARNPNITLAQLRAFILGSGDVVQSLSTKVSSRRRLNVLGALSAAVDTASPASLGMLEMMETVSPLPSEDITAKRGIRRIPPPDALRLEPAPGPLPPPDDVVLRGNGERFAEAQLQNGTTSHRLRDFVVQLEPGVQLTDIQSRIYNLQISQINKAYGNNNVFRIRVKSDASDQVIVGQLLRIPGIATAEPNGTYKLQ
jgi:subtilisin family serine protease